MRRPWIALAAWLLSLPVVPAQEMDPPRPPEGEGVTVRAITLNARTRQPIPGVAVTLSRRTVVVPEDRRTWTYKATSGQDGAVRFENVQADGYFISATLAGYSGAGFTNLGVLDRLEPGDSPEPVTLLLLPAPAVSGTVEDEEGAPRAGVHVVLLNNGWEAGVRKIGSAPSVIRPVTTDPEGRFTFPSVPPGAYLLEAVPAKPDDPYLDTFFPGATDPAAAAAVTVFAGVDQSGLRVRMKKGARLTVSGHVEGLPEGTAEPNVVLTRVPGRDSSLRMGARLGPDPQAPVAPDGSFSFSGVQPGTYLATVYSGRSSLYASSFVEAADEDVTDLRVVFQPTWTFAGRVLYPDGTPPKAQLASLLHFDPADGYSLTRLDIAADGTFAARNLPAGEYRLAFAPDGMMVEKIALTDRSFSGSRFTLLAPGTERAEITMGRGAATISGSFEPAGRDYAGDGYVSVHTWPMSMIASASLIRQLRGSTQFSFPNLEPGTYRVCAWDQDFNRIYEIINNPANWMQLGAVCKTIELREDESRQVQLKQVRVASFN